MCFLTLFRQNLFLWGSEYEKLTFSKDEEDDKRDKTQDLKYQKEKILVSRV